MVSTKEVCYSSFSQDPLATVALVEPSIWLHTSRVVEHLIATERLKLSPIRSIGHHQ